MARLSLLAAAALSLPAPSRAADIDFEIEADQGASELRKRLTELSAAKGVKRDASERDLRRAAAADAKTFARALIADGYFTATTDFALTEESAVRFQVTPGPRYRITQHVFEYADGPAAGRPAGPSEIGIEAGDSPAGAELARIADAARDWFRAHGYPLAQVTEQYVKARAETAEARAIYRFETGRQSVFGPIRWPADLGVDIEYLQRFQTWKEGELFDRSKLAAFRAELAGTSLFSTLNVRPGEPSDDEGAPSEDGEPQAPSAPVIVEAGPRKYRTIGAGVSYSTNFGAGGNVFWEHRNAFGGGELARVELTGTQVEQSLTGDFRKPLRRPGALIDYRMAVGRQDNDAFESRSVLVGFAYDRPFWGNNRLSTGLEAEAAEITDATGTRQTVLISAPLELYRSTIDDRLNPTTGSRIAVSGAPHAGDGGLYFSLFEANAAAHRALRKDEKLIASGWSRLGFTLGPDTFELPATKRFYAGGAGSIRGFGFQLAGPLDENGVPTGGRSVWAAGSELRARIGEQYGVVGFLEAGSAFDRAYPDFRSEPLVGAGVGARYYTAVGPIRFDVAFPINKRDGGVDDPFQIYISIGQAF